MKHRFIVASLLALLLTSCASFDMPQSTSKHEVYKEPEEYDVWDGTVASTFEYGDGTQNNPYQINNAKELAYFRSSLSAKSYYLNKFVTLNVNIDLNNIDWLGIGTGTSGGSFKGTFNGNNRTIKNISMNVTAERKGFFNSNSGTIRGLNINNVFLSGGITNGIAFGLFVGINYGNISSCTSSGNVNVVGKYVGGFIGCNAGGNLELCSYLGGTGTGTNCIGGIIGYNMVSSNKIGSLTNCKNFGTISAKDYLVENYSGLGGIIGVCGSGATISHCENHGDVIGSGKALGGTGGIIGNNFNTYITDCVNTGDITGSENIGGIVGNARNSTTVNNSRNQGKISGGVGVAGIVGYCRSNITNCVNNGEINGNTSNISYWVGGIVGMLGSNLTVQSCSNEGYVHGLGSTNGGVGGIAGSNYNSTIKDCDNSNLVKGKYRIGGIVGFAQATGGYVLNCVNNGDFESIATFGTVSLGGIVGYNQATIIGCVNNGQYIIDDDISIEMYGYIVGYDTVGEGKVYNNINNK